MLALVPDRFHRLVVVRRAPPGSFDRHAAELRAALDAFRGIDLPLCSFFARDASGAMAPCEPARDLLPLLGRSTILWAQRGPNDPSHALRLFNEESGDAYADLCTSFVLDAEEPRVSPGLVVEARLGRFIEAAPDRPPVEALRAAFDALVRAFQPDFGFIEPAGTTAAAPSRPDRPVVRWLTYLSSAWQPVRDLTAPNTSYAVADLGTAYLATAELASAAEASQKQALARLQLALHPVDPAARPPAPPPETPAAPRPVVAPAIPSFLQRAPEQPRPPPSQPAAPAAEAPKRAKHAGTVDLSALAPSPPAAALPFAGAPAPAPERPAPRPVPRPPAQNARTADIEAALAEARSAGPLPFAKLAGSKPVASPPAAPPPAPRSVPKPNTQNARTLDIEAALAEARGGGSLPFAKPADPKPAPPPAAPPPAAPPAVAAPPLTLEQYASLSAELHVYPENSGELMARYGVTGRASYEALVASYRARFERDPAALQTFRQLETQFRDWSFRSKWRAR